MAAGGGYHGAAYTVLHSLHCWKRRNVLPTFRQRFIQVVMHEDAMSGGELYHLLLYKRPRDAQPHTLVPVDEVSETLAKRTAVLAASLRPLCAGLRSERFGRGAFHALCQWWPARGGACGGGGRRHSQAAQLQ